MIMNKVLTNQENYCTEAVKLEDELLKIIYCDGGMNKTTGKDAWATVTDEFGNCILGNFDMFVYSDTNEEMKTKEITSSTGKMTKNLLRSVSLNKFFESMVI